MTRHSKGVRLLAAGVLALAALPANAQLSRLFDQVKAKVEQKVEQKVVETVVDGPAASSTGSAPVTSKRLRVNEAHDFVPGNVPLFQDDFSAVAPGRMPATWKTNGSGRVVTLQGLEGRWLELGTSSNFKLAKPVTLPTHFSVEFDLVAVADQIDDLGAMHFGFSPDNSVSDVGVNEIASVGLGYMNGDDGTTRSSATGYYHTFDFDFSGYANRIMHVAIDVDGDQMRVYLDKTKIADAALFRNNVGRHFYLSAPWSVERGAKLLAGNFRIAAFR